MSVADLTTAETIAAVKKAQTAGITVGTNITGFDLTGLISLIPANTPFFDRIGRVSGKGSKNAQWKALTNINNLQPNPFTGLEAGGGKVQFNEQEVFAPYQPLRMAGGITRDSIDLELDGVDAKALSVAGTLTQWRLGANKAYIAGQAYALPAIGNPVLSSSGTGGTIGANVTAYVRVAARSAYNYSFGGSGIASAEVSLAGPASGTSNSFSATVANVKGAVAFDWFIGSAAGQEKYYTTTTTNTVTFTNIPASNNAVPTIPGLSGTPVTAVPATDTSYSQNAFNGLFATTLGDYGSNALVTPGSGTPSGATFMSLDGAKLTSGGQGVQELDNLLLNIWATAQLSPTSLIMNGQQAQDITNRILASGMAQTYLQPQSGRTGIVGGGTVTKYINKAAGGQEIDIVVDPSFPVGSVAAITEKVDYPNVGFVNTFEARTLRDVQQWDYGVAWQQGNGGGPAEVWDVSSVETFINRAPVTMGILSNIQNG